jgi:hypothetical protein
LAESEIIVPPKFAGGSPRWTLPVLDKRTETQRVALKLERIITRTTVRGTQRNAPTMPQTVPHKINAIITVNGLRLRVSPMIFGSTIFPINMAIAVIPMPTAKQGPI